MKERAYFLFYMKKTTQILHIISFSNSFDIFIHAMDIMDEAQSIKDQLKNQTS